MATRLVHSGNKAIIVEVGVQPGCWKEASKLIVQHQSSGGTGAAK